MVAPWRCVAPSARSPHPLPAFSLQVDIPHRSHMLVLVELRGWSLRARVRCGSLKMLSKVFEGSHPEARPKHLHIVTNGCLTAALLRCAVRSPRSPHLLPAFSWQVDVSWPAPEPNADVG
jgi:hypothetical protein